MRIDPRGPRFAAVLTTLVLAAVLVSGSPWLLAAQAAVFALGAFVGLHASPYAVAFRRLVRPRLGPPAELEAAAPPRFAQGVGLVFALAGLTGFAAGSTVISSGAVAVAFGAAFLNAAFGLCLGCEAYLILLRVSPRRTARTVRKEIAT